MIIFSKHISVIHRPKHRFPLRTLDAIMAQVSLIYYNVFELVEIQLHKPRLNVKFNVDNIDQKVIQFFENISYFQYLKHLFSFCTLDASIKLNTKFCLTSIKLHSIFNKQLLTDRRTDRLERNSITRPDSSNGRIPHLHLMFT